MTKDLSASSFSLQRTLNGIPRALVYLTGALPGIWVFYLAAGNRLGADPVKALEHELGLWAFRFLIVGLAITPLWRLGGPRLIRYRRAFGLLAFFYALAHVTVYAILDQGLDGAAILADIWKRPYITAGMVAFAILLPLAITSNNAMIKRLQGAWNSLHRWVYVAAIAAALHYILAVKSWPPEPVIYAGLVALFLGVRLILTLRKRWWPSQPKTAL